MLCPDKPPVVDSVQSSCDGGFEPRTVLWGGLTRPLGFTVYRAVARGGGGDLNQANTARLVLLVRKNTGAVLYPTHGTYKTFTVTK